MKYYSMCRFRSCEHEQIIMTRLEYRGRRALHVRI